MVTVAAKTGVPAAPMAGPLPWLAGPLREALATQRAHAILLRGPQGVGQFEMAQALAQAWLCESPLPGGACGTCAGCRLVQARSHPDLLVLVPEALRESLGVSASEDGEGDTGAAATDGTGSKSARKPSKDIRVEEVRRVVAFAQTTAARGRGKVVLLFPAERMNGIAANALLKTLEEPPGDARFILAGSSVDALLPTIRSRCQSLVLPLPDTAVATAWLASHAVAQAEVLLAATGGQPEEALAWSREGIDARQWLALPQQLARGEAGPLPAWPLPRVVDVLCKLCHDAMRIAAGAAPRYFPAGAMPRSAALPALSAWSAELRRIARHAEHPWSAGLMVESLVQQAQSALRSPAPGKRAERASVH